MESVNEGQVAPLAADDSHALLESIYQPEPPMQQTQEAPTQAQERMLKLKRGETFIEKPESEVISLAQKGFDYDTNNRLLRQERELLDLQKKEIGAFDSARFKELDTLDKYAKENPKFFETVKSAWEKFQSGQSVDAQGDPVLDRLNQVESVINEFKTEKQQFQMKQDDAALDQSLKELRDKSPEINWDEKDEFGFTVEHKVLRHIADKGYPSPRAAFMDLYGEKLADLRSKNAVESKVKEIQDRHSKGFILDKRLTSPNAFKPQAPKNLSYDDLADISMRELGIR
mgnify:CR=1 FL=1